MMMQRLVPPDDPIPFIITTPARQSVQQKRRLIRSHVMRGKNRKKLPSRPPSWISGGKGNETLEIETKDALSIPAKVGGELSFSAFPAEMSPEILEFVCKLKQTMYPLELGLAFDQDKSSWLGPISNDAACLHFTIFIAKTYKDFVLGQNKNNKTALAHFSKTLDILQHRLASTGSGLSTSDSTVLVIVGLTMAATILGDFESALSHLSGLHKMVMLRGGISAFNGNRQLQAKICRVDLGVVLGTGCKPLFFSDGILWNSYIVPQGRYPLSGNQEPGPGPQECISELGRFLDSLDTRLRLVWEDLSEFVRAVNIATQCQRSIDGELYQEVMVSVHYRLVNLCFDTDSVDETTRLALLVFASSLFLQWRDSDTRHEHLAQSFINALFLVNHEAGTMPAMFILWLYVIGAISILNKTEQAWFKPAMAEVLRNITLKSWNEVKLSLQSVLWVNVMHDIPAKQMIETVLLEP